MADSRKKADVTREKIVTSALELFGEQGFEKTTMRAIAQRSGMSLGSAYYYFRSKEELMQGFYAQLFSTFSARIGPELQGKTDFRDRLNTALRGWVDNARPFHDLASGFFKFAADPKSPLSPFSAESAPIRDAVVNLYREVVEGSKISVPSPLNEQLPEMLWLYQMGVVLFWVYDDSPEQAKTMQLIERTVPLVTRLIGLARLPGLRNIAADLTKLFAELRA